MEENVQRYMRALQVCEKNGVKEVEVCAKSVVLSEDLQGLQRILESNFKKLNRNDR